MTTRKMKGSWYVDVYVDIPGEGRQRVRRKSPVNTKRGAERYEQALVEELIWSSSRKKTPDRRFEDFAVEFLRRYVDVHLKYSTKVSYRSALEVHLVPYFEGKTLQDIDAPAIAGLQAFLLDGGRRAPKTVHNLVAVLTAALGVARDWGYLEAVPHVKRVRVPKPAFRFLTVDEAHRLVDASNDTWRSMITLALRTGLRLGELRALTWEQVDTGARSIRVDRAVWRDVHGTPKHDRVRDVAFSSQTAGLLDDLAARASGDLVFPKQCGEVRGQHWCCEALRKYSSRAGIGSIGWHVLRHTYATQLVAAGVPIPVIQQQLGHQDVSTTMRYAHVIEGATHEAAERLDAFVTSRRGHHLGTERPEAPEVAD